MEVGGAPQATVRRIAVVKMTLWTLCQSTLLLLNAIAILHGDRFLARCPPPRSTLLLDHLLAPLAVAGVVCFCDLLQLLFLSTVLTTVVECVVAARRSRTECVWVWLAATVLCYL